jgi:hypothetical protein
MLLEEQPYRAPFLPEAFHCGDRPLGEHGKHRPARIDPWESTLGETCAMVYQLRITSFLVCSRELVVRVLSLMIVGGAECQSYTEILLG